MTDPHAPHDITTTVEIIAARLLQQGATHPVAAALVLAARGQDGTDPAGFAATAGLTIREIQALEAGEVALEDLPAQVSQVLDRTGRVDLLAMADLDADIRRRRAARQAQG